MRDDLDLAVAHLRDLNHVAEIAGAAVHLDAVVQELLKRVDVENLVVGRLRRIDDELFYFLQKKKRKTRTHTHTQSWRKVSTFLFVWYPFL